MILLPATIESIATRKDRTVSVKIGTQELDPNKAGKVLVLQNKLCFVAIKETEFQPDEIEMLSKANEDIDTVGKSSSERLRNVIYVLYKQDNQGFTEFDSFYRNKMEAIINHLKTKIK